MLFLCQLLLNFQGVQALIQVRSLSYKYEIPYLSGQQKSFGKAFYCPVFCVQGCIRKLAAPQLTPRTESREKIFSTRLIAVKLKNHNKK